jgi:hypothetical protein
MWWWGAARPAYEKLGRSVPPVEVEYAEAWPPADRLEHFREVFDGVAVSYFGLNPASVEQKDIAPDRTLLQTATDAVLWTARANVRPQQWLWAEAPWSSHPPALPHEWFQYRLLLHRDYATLLFGMDHCRGALLWQAKDRYVPPMNDSLFTREGEIAKTADYPLLKAVSTVITANVDFFSAYHEQLNPDGFPVAEPTFREDDPDVLTRLVGRHLLLFSEAPTMRKVRLTNTQGRRLREVPTGAGYSQPWTLTITPEGEEALVVDRIRPGVLYLLEVMD